MDSIELRITIDKEAVEAIVTLLGALAARPVREAREEREESTKEVKEESEENDINTQYTSCPNNNINNNNISLDACMHIVKDNSGVKDKSVIRNIDAYTQCNKDSNTCNRSEHSVIQSSTVEYEEPTLEAITKYITNCKYNLNANKFFNYYNVKQWKTKNGTDMKPRWKEFVDSWAKYEYNVTGMPAPKAQAGSVEERRAGRTFVPTVFD